jgi:hypothetical protein
MCYPQIHYIYKVHRNLWSMFRCLWRLSYCVCERSAYIVASEGQSKPAKRLSDHRVYSTVHLDIKESSATCRRCSFRCMHPWILNVHVSFKGIPRVAGLRSAKLWNVDIFLILNSVQQFTQWINIDWNWEQFYFKIMHVRCLICI